MSTSDPLVSVITPAYNSSQYLSQTIESVLQQTYHNWEMLIIVDHNSDTETERIARQKAHDDGRIKVHRHPCAAGVSHNRNLGLEKSQGEYWAFLDSDDLWLPQKLEKQLAHMQQTHSAFSYHSYHLIDHKSVPLGRTRKAQKKLSFDDLLADNAIGCLTVMVKAELVGNITFKNHKHEDYLLWLELTKAGHHATPIEEPLALYRIQAHSLSGNKLKAALWRWRIYQQLNLPLTQRVASFIQYGASSLRKRL